MFLPWVYALNGVSLATVAVPPVTTMHATECVVQPLGP
jgi:hypothetical protein